MTPARKAPAALDPDSQSARMLSYLRDVLKARRIRYKDVAALMGVSEKSIKRYMAGHGVTLPVLERLCATVGMGLRELAELADAEPDQELHWTTPEQESVLVADPRLSIVLALLSTGWTASRIEQEGLASPSDLNAILARLDRLGVITLYPKNRVRVRARLRGFDTGSDALRQVIAEAGARVLRSLDLTDPASLWRLTYARLGPASVARVSNRLDAFLDEVAELSRQDMDLSGDQVKWYALCGLMTEHEVLGLKLLQDSAGAAPVRRRLRP